MTRDRLLLVEKTRSKVVLVRILGKFSLLYFYIGFHKKNASLAIINLNFRESG
jgi:hypothetical protein